MPNYVRKRKTPRYRKKKTMYRKKRSYRKKRRVLPLLSSGIGRGNKFYARLKYMEQIQIVPNISTPQTYQFRANDLYDPNKTGTGHQPMGFDQICSVDGWYTRFRVLGSKIRVKMVACETSDFSSLYMGIDTTREDTAFGYSSVSQWYEQGTRSRIKLLAPSLGVGGLGFQASQVVAGWSAKKSYPKQQLGDFTQCGTYSNSPPETWLYNINYAYAGNNAVDQRIFLAVEIDYIAEFSDSLPILPQS